MNSEKAVSQRLKAFVDSLNLSVTKLSKKVGVSQTGLNSVVKGKTQPSSKILSPLSELGLSLDWLYTGEGTMIRDRKQLIGDKSTTRPTIHVEELMQKMLDYKEETLRASKKTIETQSILIKKQQKEIEEFKQLIEQLKLQDK